MVMTWRHWPILIVLQALLLYLLVASPTAIADRNLTKRSSDDENYLYDSNVDDDGHSDHNEDVTDDDINQILFPETEAREGTFPSTEYTLNVSSLVQVVLYCDLHPTFCNKVQVAYAAAATEFIRVVNIKNSLRIAAYYYRFCDNKCSNDTIAWAVPSSQFTLPFEDGADLNYIYPQTLAKQLVPYGITSSWDDWDIEMDVNHDYYLCAVDFDEAYEKGWNGTDVPPGGKFWFQNETAIRSGQIDLKYVFLHEILHGAGFGSSWGDHLSHEASPFRQLLQGIFDPIELQLLTPSPLWVMLEQMGPIYVIGFQPTMIFDKFLVNVDASLHPNGHQSMADLGFEIQSFCVSDQTSAYISNFVNLFNRYGKSIPARELWLSMGRNHTLEFQFPPPAISNSSFSINDYLKSKYSRMVLSTGQNAMTSRLELGGRDFRPSLSNSHVGQMYAVSPDFLMTDDFRTGQTLDEIVKEVYADIDPIMYLVPFNGTLVNQTYQSPIGPGILRILDTMGYSTVLTNTNYMVNSEFNKTAKVHTCDAGDYDSLQATAYVSSAVSDFDASSFLIAVGLVSWLFFM
ncbi:hypothetical protein DFQ30_009531 [Apophysomyces sp. BC1015]|nr:hypothetical protein DFQ30_009531 [Apophysomyces sp. BC1015]KAG0177980.1 hypothetical protein DFQ29_004113 [Apophysomyces sp. BC1021]